MDCYIIPHQDKFIVYRPLLKLAFVANAAMVNLVTEIQKDDFCARTDHEKNACEFLSQVGFFESEQSFPKTDGINSHFQPSTAILFLTNACNFRCIYCYASAGESKVMEMPIDLGKKAILRVCRNAEITGEDHFLLGFHGGGEPSLAKQTLKSLVEFTRTLHIPGKIQLTTNGCWSDDYSDWLMENIDEISLSFDGMQAVQDRQRPLADGSGSFNRVMKTIQRLDNRKLPYGIRMTVTEEGIDTLHENMSFLCNETGCPVFQVEPAFKQGRAVKSHIAVEQNEKFSDAFLDAFEIAETHGRHIYYSGARPWLIAERFCQAPENALIVGPNGFLTACYEICDPSHELSDQFLFGSLSADQGLSIDNNCRERLIRKVAERRDKCRNCFCFWHCAGDCPSKTFSTQDDGHLVYGDRCDLNRLITKGLILHYIEQGNGIWRDDRPVDTCGRMCE